MPEAWTLSLVWPLPRLGRKTPPGSSLSGSASASDEALFERVCSTDDHAAFGILVTRYRARVTALVRRMLAAEQSDIDPDDVAQEAFVHAYRRRATFRQSSLLRPWLYGIAVNRCLDRLRVHERERNIGYALLPSDDGLRAAVHEEGTDPLHAMIQRQEITNLERAIGGLPVKLRAVLVLRYLDELSYEEIAIACDMPIGTVKTHLFRARAELKRRLSDAD